MRRQHTPDSSEEMDAFTTEYTKILKQLPSMLKSTEEAIPQHLQNYIKIQDTSYSSGVCSPDISYPQRSKHTKSKSKRKHSRHHKSSRHFPSNPSHKNKSSMHSKPPITIIDDNEHYDYPPLITDSYFNITKYIASSASHSTNDSLFSTHSSYDPHMHQIKQNKKRKRGKHISSSCTVDHEANGASKVHVTRASHHISNVNDDTATIQQLKHINEMLSASVLPDIQKEDDQHNELEVIPVTTTIIHQKHISTQTEDIESNKEVHSVSIQTNEAPVRINTANTKINDMICKITKQLNEKTTQCMALKQDNVSLEKELKATKKQCIECGLEINRWKQQMEDQNIYNNNLMKHLDEKSRNEALLRKEINEQQKQLEAAHFKLQQFLIPKRNKNENNEINELREHLMLSEQKCIDWKKKWKQQCFKIEQLESEKVMTQHRVDQQFQEYQKIIQDFRSMMKNNLESVNNNFQNLNQENMILKKENERLLFELGKFQENAFKTGLKEHLKEDLNEKNNEINALTQQLNTLQKNLEQNHLNESMDKSIQCVMELENDENDEFNQISIEIYKLIMDLKSKSFDIINEYGFDKSLTNSPNGKRKKNDDQLYDDTDDVDRTSLIINCKKRFYDTTQMLKQLLKWLDDVMFQQAETQCDQCITQ